MNYFDKLGGIITLLIWRARKTPGSSWTEMPLTSPSGFPSTREENRWERHGFFPAGDDFAEIFHGFSKGFPRFLWDFSLLKSIHWRFRVKIDVDCRQADMGVNLLKPLEMLQAIMAYLGKDATEEWVMIHKPGRLGVGWSKWPWQHINGHFRNRFIGGTYHI